MTPESIEPESTCIDCHHPLDSRRPWPHTQNRSSSCSLTTTKKTACSPRDALDESRVVNDLRFVEDGEELLDYLYQPRPVRRSRAAPSPGSDPARPEHAAEKTAARRLREIKADPTCAASRSSS